MIQQYHIHDSHVVKIKGEQENDKRTKTKKLQHKRQKCIVYTRVMGYHRPVESFNIGKTGEHRQRLQFVE